MPSYDYDRRTAGSATPTFDTLFKNESKVMASLETAIKKVHPLADKIEKAEGDKVAALCEQAVDAAYKAFDPWRPLISKGESELSGSSAKSEREAKLLLQTAKELSKAYNQAAEGKQNKDAKMMVDGVDALARALSTLKTVYGQYIRAYGH